MLKSREKIDFVIETLYKNLAKDLSIDRIEERLEYANFTSTFGPITAMHPSKNFRIWKMKLLRNAE